MGFNPDYLVVGAGLTGATIARLLTDAGKTVLVLERRSHVGGNAYDTVHPSGIRYNLYGPHIFHTNSQWVWDFLHDFSEFYRHERKVSSYVEGRYEIWPITGEYIERTVGKLATTFSATGDPDNFELACLNKLPALVYEKRVKGYTEKQWGVPANNLSPDLAARIHVNWDNDSRLYPNYRFQGLPVNGYTSLVERMLEGIPVILNCHYSAIGITPARKMIYTGSLDELFNFDLGHLPYRALRRTHHYNPDHGYCQPMFSVTYPEAEYEQVRVIEWKHQLLGSYPKDTSGTWRTAEVPFTPTDPDRYEYPFPSDRARELYRKYKKRADEIPNLEICGRLGDYKYYDMDRAIERAAEVAHGLLKGE